MPTKRPNTFVFMRRRQGECGDDGVGCFFWGKFVNLLICWDGVGCFGVDKYMGGKRNAGKNIVFWKKIQGSLGVVKFIGCEMWVF